jgi:ubiquinone/menaquinone biosynthesis C-methylase UbiE
LTYFMESEREFGRLLEQEKRDPVRQRLVDAGLSPGQRALDAGCGPGLITQLMAEIVGPSGAVVGIDVNGESVAEAARLAGGHRNLSFLAADIRTLGLPDDSLDFVWSQFVFEYLPNPEDVLVELVRVTRPGGSVVVSDIDGVGLANYPFRDEMETKLNRAFSALRSATGFDPYIGRKMFHFFRRVGLRNIQVKLYPLYVFAGPADEPALRDWQLRFDAAERFTEKLFGGVAAWREFRDEYLRLFKDENSLKYGVILVTQGVRP